MQKSVVKELVPDELPQESPLNETSVAPETGEELLSAMSATERQRLVDQTFEEIHRKYGKALKNLAK